MSARGPVPKENGARILSISVDMSANAPSQTVFSIGYDFHLGNGTSGSDNGNVWNIYNYRDHSREITG